MIALVAILLQMGPPTPVCTAPAQLLTGQVATCDGVLIPASDLAASLKAERACAADLAAAAKIADERVRSCSAGVEIVHASIDGLASVFERSQADSAERVLEAIQPACPWYECPGWEGVGVAAALTTLVMLWEPWSDDPWGRL